MTDTSSTDPAPDGLGRRAVRGATVTVAGQVARVLVQLLSVVILARLLNPEAYGQFAMVMTVAGIAEVFRDFGLTQAAVQAKTLSVDQRNALFWINTGIGAVLAVAVFFSSWPVSAFFVEPDVRPLIQFSAVAFVLNGVATQFRAGLTRSLRFTALATTDVSSTVIGLGTGVAFAVGGFGAWSLVIQFLTQSLVVLVSVVAFAHWVPRWPKRGTDVRAFTRFGSHMVATQIVTYMGNNIDSITIGARFGAVPLGVYNRAYQLVMNTANQMRAPITNVAIPILARLQDSPVRYWEFARVGQIALGYTIVAVLGWVVGAAQPLTAILLGAKWLESAPILSLLAAAAALQTLGYFGYWVYVSKGITGALFGYNLISVAIKVLAIVVGSQWGVNGVAVGYLLAAAASWPLSLMWIARAIDGVPIAVFTWGFIRMSVMAGVGAGASFAASDLAQPLGSWPAALCAILATLTCYVVGFIGFRPVRRDLRDVWFAISLLHPRPDAPRTRGPRKSSDRHT
ncbi:lipopolysaccharide biosynthesis protein [Glaciibacter flavus]|uniref:Lipopolysaccharide biosynthesis protein n=1 Tax=Orlajensenia flava TaxID=2565934 RepID=A0A4S4FK92_9MICO|nr:lipopolysaccharide biosynthesis protein [Glaciibacter flavus]THG30548.1 lipopolysaccharide biosynthesis protein [Glaciibacter flavus]